MAAALARCRPRLDLDRSLHESTRQYTRCSGPSGTGPDPGVPLGPFKFKSQQQGVARFRFKLHLTGPPSCLRQSLSGTQEASGSLWLSDVTAMVPVHRSGPLGP
jgi:hypothetical protein